ncbi:MAG: class I mannose-6-phosphate isomerase [Sphaerochaeta sp.]
MSFMFNPYPYDDFSAVNAPLNLDASAIGIVEGNQEVAKHIGSHVIVLSRSRTQVVLCIDGYATASFLDFVRRVGRYIMQNSSLEVELISIERIYKASHILDELFAEYLPNNLEEDPILLFGRLMDKDETIFFDTQALKKLKNELSQSKENTVRIVYGNFGATPILCQFYDAIAYIDVIPKNVILRLKEGESSNIGDARVRTYRSVMRRAYYVDFEASIVHRTRLLKSNKITWYILGNNTAKTQLVEWNSFREICKALVRNPLRCKPVYNEGVWGGYFTIKHRNLPNTMRNCAWVFDLIPSEVSLLVKVNDILIDIPFYTFIRMESLSLLGEESIEKFGEYFPVRFNYDDTMHSSGNMSIQVHPDEQYCIEKFNELGRQDESYYVIATAPNAKTYCGFKEDADTNQFLELIKKSERDGSSVEYETYVHSEESVAGKQFLLPAGTIHASGRNQLVLEIGSLTVGSYTFKLYDYLRKDLDGTQRPIHSLLGERVLRTDRKSSWVKSNLIQDPTLLVNGEGWEEYLLGEHDLLYFSLRRIEIDNIAFQDTAGKFHVLCLSEGEKVQVVSVEEESLSFTMKYLDIIIVPATMGKYRIVNLSNHPVAIHKTLLK